MGKAGGSVLLHSAGGNSVTDGVFGQVGYGVQIELVHDVAAMNFDCRWCQLEALGYVGRRAAFGDQMQHLLFPVAELGE